MVQLFPVAQVAPLRELVEELVGLVPLRSVTVLVAAVRVDMPVRAALELLVLILRVLGVLLVGLVATVRVDMAAAALGFLVKVHRQQVVLWLPETVVLVALLEAQEMAAHMAAVVVETQVLVRATVLWVLFALFGPVQPASFLQQTQVTCDGTLYSTSKRATV